MCYASSSHEDKKRIHQEGAMKIAVGSDERTNLTDTVNDPSAEARGL